MALGYRIRLLDHLKHDDYRPANVPVVMEQLRIPEEEADDFTAAVERLVKDGVVERLSGDRLGLPAMPGEVVGRLRVARGGFGFLIPDSPFRDGDLFIPEGAMADALDGDRVRAAVRRHSGRGRGRPGRSDAVGSIVEVLERRQSSFVGELVRHGRDWVVEPDGRRLREPVVIRDPHAKNAKEGDKVVFELLHYPEDGYLGEGVITSVLGEAGRPDVETQAVIEGHGLRTVFPAAATDEARDATERFDDEQHGKDVAPAGAIAYADREDLTQQFVFTIDPQDSRDFDAAISLEFDEAEGLWTLGVHIADVAHFVRPGSELDKEAAARGNSVYLPRLVIPMLPEVLSNGICSLQEGVPRFAKSVFVRLDRKGKVIDQRVSATLIKSAKRLTYEEAQALIDGDEKRARKHARTRTEYTDDLRQRLRWADDLARTIRKRRQKSGMIALNLPEVELVFDDAGHVVDAVPEDDSYTHTIIEMFMVEANEAIARLFAGLEVPVLRRIHPDPNFNDVQELRQFAAVLGFRVPEHPDREELQRLLDATREHPAGRAIHFAVLRTLTKASYSPALIGHFALASTHYAHFTSPIRRYPDLQVHRCLETYLELTENGRNAPGGRKRAKLAPRMLEDARCPSEDELVTLGAHCSSTEANASEAERSLREFLVLQHLEEAHLGDELPGVVTGFNSRGVFVSIERYLVDGFVGASEMPSQGGGRDGEREELPRGRDGGRRERARRAKGAPWRMDRDTGRFVALRTGQSLGIGDLVTVQIVAVDPSSRSLELRVTKLPERTHVVPPADRPDADRDRGGRGGKGGKGKSSGKPAYRGGPKKADGAKGRKGKGRGKAKGRGRSR